MAGGFSNFQNISPEVQKYLDIIKDQIEFKIGKNFSKIVGVQFQKQIVAGTNYIIIALADNQKINVKLFVSLPVRDKLTKQLVMDQVTLKDVKLVSAKEEL